MKTPILFCAIFFLFWVTSCDKKGSNNPSPTSSADPTPTPTPTTPSITYPFHLSDPAKAANHKFGVFSMVLPNGNLVIRSTNESVLSNSGAVHLYKPDQKTPIASIVGDNTNDRFGEGSITALSDSHFVIVSHYDSVDGVSKAGSVTLVSAEDGSVVSRLTGDNASDAIGFNGITPLANGHFVVASQADNVNGLALAGSIRLVNGTTGAVINSIAGDNAGDALGSSGVVALANNNFAVASSFDNVGGNGSAGSVHLINGNTGAVIATISGDAVNDSLGSGGLKALSNNNFVISSPKDGFGSVMLINGTTGAVINTISGNDANDQLGSSGITVISNDNFVIASEYDDVGGVVDAGSVILVNGTTGVQIGTTISGDGTEDRLGNSGVTSLPNNNYVIASSIDHNGAIDDAGSVILVSGSTGSQLGLTIRGDNANDRLGSSSITPLANNNFVLASQNDTVGGVATAGSVMLVSGLTAVVINTLSGDNVSDNFGRNITALSNSNFVIRSHLDDHNGVANVGSVMLVNGNDGIRIADTFYGDDESDRLGQAGITRLSNDNFVIATPRDDVNGVVNAGSVKVIHGVSGEQIGETRAGDNTEDFFGGSNIIPISGNRFAIVSEIDDVDGVTDAGSVIIVEE